MTGPIDPENCTSEARVCGAIRSGYWKLVIGTEVAYPSENYTGWPALPDVDTIKSTVQCGNDNRPPALNFSLPPYNGVGALYNMSRDHCTNNCNHTLVSCDLWTRCKRSL